MKNKMKKRVALFLAIVMSVMALTGCGGTSENSSEAPSAEEPGTATSVAENGKTQVTGVMNANVTTLYPFAGPSEGSNPWKWQAFEYLFVCGSDGKLHNQIAKNYTMSDDGLIFDIEIYDYVYDAEGNHITADDVVFCFETAKETGNFFGVGLGFVESIEKTGDYSVRFTYSKSVVGVFEYCMYYIPIISQKAFEESTDEMATSIVTTNPYKVTEFVSGSSITLEKRDDYWQENESERCYVSEANVDIIKLMCIPEISQRKVALESGTVDIAMLDAQSVPSMEEKGFRVDVADTFLTTDLQISKASSSPCADENFRKAICCAIDRDALIENLYGKYATKSAYAVRQASDYNPEWVKNYPYELDLEKAKEYLAKSAYPNGAEITVMVDASNDSEKRLAELLQAYLTEINVTVEIKLVETAIRSEELKNPEAYDIAINGKRGLYTAKIFNSVFDRNNYSTGATFCGLVDDELQALVDAASNSATHSQETVNALYDYFTEHALWGPLAWVESPFVIAADSSLKELTFTEMERPIFGSCTYTWNE